MKNILIIIVVTLLISSCKKDDPTPTPLPSSSSTNNLTSGLPANTASINGVFLAYKFAALPSMNTYYESYAGLYRTGQSLQSINPTSTVVIGHDNGGSIKIDGDILKFETTNPAYLHRYTDTLLTPNYSQAINWAFTGDTSFAGFNVNAVRGFPAMNNPNVFPNSISKTQTLTINFSPNNISSTDSIAVQITGSALNVTRTVAGNSSSISFIPSDFSGATIGGTAQMAISLKNYSNATITNKTYVFILVNSFTGYTTINP